MRWKNRDAMENRDVMEPDDFYYNLYVFVGDGQKNMMRYFDEMDKLIDEMEKSSAMEPDDFNYNGKY